MSAPEATYTFPAPVGGVPFDLDFAPSILFAALFGLVSLLAIYRFARSSTRTICTLGTVAFIIERVVIFALRAKQAHDPSERSSNGLTQYWQISFAVGYLSILTDLTGIMRSLLVTSSYGTTTKAVPSSEDTSRTNLVVDDSEQRGGYASMAFNGDDQPRARFCYRRICGNLTLLSWVPVITGTIAGIQYTKGEHDSSTADRVQILRYATTGIAFGQLLIVQGLAIWSYLRVPRIRRSGALLITSIAMLLNVVSVYRLIVMRNKTPALESTGPHSLNSTMSKTMFYIFHVAPELLAALALFAVNVRDVFGTGMFGDYRHRDPKPKAEVELQ